MIKRIKEFLREVKIEIKKVVFPSKDELIGSTWVVIVVVLIISVFLGIVDLGLSKIVGLALR
jgi:preprotein translocase subunit SecE